jgi:hypothetical protein
MDLSADQLTNVRQLLLGTPPRWDSGELARVLIAGITLAAIEAAPALLSLPWPLSEPGEARALVVRRELSDC